MLSLVGLNNLKLITTQTKMPLLTTKSKDTGSASSKSLPEPASEQPTISLEQPSLKKSKLKRKKPKAVKALQSMIRSLPIIAPSAQLALQQGTRTRVTGTLFGHKKGKVTLSFQETTKSLPTLVLELPMQTYMLQKEMGVGMVRIALECEKREDVNVVDGKKLMEEPRWSMFCNGKKIGVAVKREAKEEDLHVMEVLKVITMGIGVLPSSSSSSSSSSYDDDDDGDGDHGDDHEDELSYVRASFEHVVGSKDSETFHMMSPEGNNVPQISIFFVRT